MHVAEANLVKLAIKLPAAAAPAASYVPWNYSRGHLYISGQLPKKEDGTLVVGQLGKNVTVDEGQQAAKLSAIGLVAQMRDALGSLDRVKKIVKLTCFVNATPDFIEPHLIANGCSNFLVEVFGKEVGQHARCAVCMAQLPFGVAVEIDAQVEVEDAPSSL